MAGNLLFILVGLPIMIMWHGFVFKTLWGWFIVPTFSLAPLSLAFAIGIALVVRSLTIAFKVKGEDHDQLHVFFTGIVGYGLFLLIGWIVTWFI